MPVGVIYTRYSSKKQGSTEDQLRACVEHAVREGIYCDVEMICVDEAVSGRKSNRAGFQRVCRLLNQSHVGGLITYSTSRLYRRGYMANKFLQEEIVDSQLWAIAVVEQLDTRSDDWDFKTGFYAIRDDQFVKMLAMAVRNGQLGLHLNGYITGAVPAGYLGKEVPGAPLTRRGLPRRRLAVDPEQAPIVERAYERVARGIPLAEAYRRFRAEGGGCDPRSTKGKMSREAFRRLLARPAYIGVVGYGQTRNRFVGKTDSVVQDVQPDDKVEFYRDENLRIVSDQLYFAVQDRLNTLKSGPRGPRRRGDREGRPHQL